MCFCQNNLASNGRRYTGIRCIKHKSDAVAVCKKVIIYIIEQMFRIWFYIIFHYDNFSFFIRLELCVSYYTLFSKDLRYNLRYPNYMQTFNFSLVHIFFCSNLLISIVKERQVQKIKKWLVWFASLLLNWCALNGKLEGMMGLTFQIQSFDLCHVIWLWNWH